MAVRFDLLPYYYFVVKKFFEVQSFQVTIRSISVDRLFLCPDIDIGDIHQVRVMAFYLYLAGQIE